MWIAFIFQYLWDTQQLILYSFSNHISCELLSFFSIFGIHNNISPVKLNPASVVNCFHFSVSLGYTTTRFNLSILYKPLWIAFIFQYLWDTQQQKYHLCLQIHSCELLSFFSIFGIHNNEASLAVKYLAVVNCFHFSVSLGYTTTDKIADWYEVVLWIAFIFQYLWDTQQHIAGILICVICCELLSFFSIFGIHNNFLS